MSDETIVLRDHMERIRRMDVVDIAKEIVKKDESIAELEARESSWVALLCRDGDARVSAATRIIAKHTALVDGLHKKMTRWANNDVHRIDCIEDVRALLGKESEDG